MQEIQRTNTENTLPALVDRAATALMSARDSAEVLEARDMARVAYDAAKSAGRIVRAKSAHDEVIAAVYRAQGHALAIEARAKIRLADEYDAAQERGEVAKSGQRNDLVVDGNEVKPTAADLGLRRDEIHEARQLRDAELAEPGIVERVIAARTEAKEEPTKAALREAVSEANNKHVHVSANSGNNEWYTPPEIVEMARAAMGSIDTDPATSEIANEAVKAPIYYTAETDGRDKQWQGNVWMNPPYAQPLIGQFCEAAVNKYAAGEIAAACVLTNNATETRWLQGLLSKASAVCFIRGRLKYLNAKGVPENTPLQGQCVTYLGPDPGKFMEAFAEMGECWSRG